MKKVLSVLLLVAMLATLFAGCGKGESVVGTWETEIDISEYSLGEVKKAIGALNPELTESLNVSDMKVKCVMTFNEDGTYEISPVKETVDAAFDAFATQVLEGVKPIFEKELADMKLPADALDQIIATATASLKNEIGEETISSFIEGMSVKGCYKFKKGKLYTAPTAEELDAAGYELCEIADGKLTLNQGEGTTAMTSEIIISLYPIEFTRVVSE